MLYQSNRSKCTLTFNVGLAAQYSIPVFVPIQKGDLERVNHPSNTDKDGKTIVARFEKELESSGIRVRNEHVGDFAVLAKRMQIKSLRFELKH